MSFKTDIMINKLIWCCEVLKQGNHYYGNWAKFKKVPHDVEWAQLGLKIDFLV